MIRIYCSTEAEADAMWQAWTQFNRSPVKEAELYLDGHGLLWTLVRSDDGPRSAPRAAHMARIR